MKYNFMFLLILTILSFKLYSEGQEYAAPKTVSIHQLIVYPERFVNKKVNLKAFIGEKYGGPYFTLYATKDDALIDNYANSIWALQPKYKDYSKFCKNTYVELSGVVKTINNHIYIEVHGSMRPYDMSSFKQLDKTCEPTNNQMSLKN